ncbi:MAG: winged helix-turn-helix transcriptional regulator [Alphaproteobacteria bacterium]|nr:winged helix-turn-helix transcriptional regulator [Alphaproteobacteria bacterium]
MASDKSDNGTMDSESEITLGLLNAVHENSGVTQRSVARDLGIALGLTNAYLKRCIRKGYIKVRQIPSNRYAYYLTPQGFAEKARLTTEYLSCSFTFFREARQQCAAALGRCSAQGWSRVALAGAGDLAEIATLCARDTNVSLLAVIDPAAAGGDHAGLPVAASPGDIDRLDAVIVTDLTAPQDTFDALAAVMPAERILTPALLHVVRQPLVAEDATP